MERKARSIDLGIHLVRRVRSVFITRLVRRQVIKVITHARHVRIRLLRRFRINRRSIPALRVPRTIIVLIAIRTLSVRQCPIRRRFQILSFGPTRARLTNYSQLQFSQRVNRYRRAIVRVEILNVPLICPASHSKR